MGYNKNENHFLNRFTSEKLLVNRMVDYIAPVIEQVGDTAFNWNIDKMVA